MQLAQPEEAAIIRERVRRRGFYEFVKLAWPYVESSPFIDSWHIGAICEFLEACQRREIRKGVINVPPGCTKSLLVSGLYPPWCWTLDPTERFMCASYDDSLSNRDARRHRDLVMSDWYQASWGHQVSIASKSVKQVKDFANSAGGFRFSTSIAGKATGRHATQRIIDDPIKPKDTMGGSDMTRKRLHACDDWFRGTWSTRTTDVRRIIDLLIMQRLHDADLAALFLSLPGIEALILPMRAETKRRCMVMGKYVDPRTEDGQLLCPARFPEEAVKQLENDLGPFASAQLQQDPVPATGGIFKREWVQYWSPDGKIPGTVKLPSIGWPIQSWDMAFKGTETSDYVVGQCWGTAEARFWLLDQERARMNVGETIDALVRFTARNPKAISKLIEAKANGQAVIDLMSKKIVGLMAVEPEGGKESRANAVSGLWRSGSVFLPHPSLAPWVTDFVEELCRFPKAPHDDQVDAMSQALTYLAAHANPLVAAMAAMKKNPGMLGPLTGQKS